MINSMHIVPVFLLTEQMMEELMIITHKQVKGTGYWNNG